MLKILIVDDEKPICEWLIHTLNTLPIPCEIIGVCHNGVDAKNTYFDKQPDVLITDIKMPVQDGLSFLREILPSPNCYVVVLSNYDDFAYARETLTLGASDFILKTEIDKESLGQLILRAQKYLSAKSMSNDKRNLPQLSHFLCTLDTETMIDPERVIHVFADSGIRLKEENYLVITLNIPVLNENIAEALFSFLAASTIIKNSYLCYLNNESYLLIGNISDKISDSYIPSAIRSFCYALFKQIPFSIGVSMPTSGWQLLPTAISQSLRALDTAFFSRHDVFFYKADLTDIDYLQSEYETICKFIFKKDYNNANTILENIFSKIENNPHMYSKSFILTYMQSIISALIIIHSGVNYPIIIKKMRETDASVSVFKHFDELKIYMQKAIHSYAPDSFSDHYSYHISKAIKYIESHYTLPLTLQDAANYVNLRAEYFSRLFKKDTGLNFVQYLNQLRLQHAMFLLRTTTDKIPVIAQKCGYNNTNYFCIHFKQIIGKTPGIYRRDFR